jgi:prepilin-type N-terminal cleavage/methylation domain-containing protein
MKKNNAGFSLVELVVVIAIIAILSGIGLYGVGQIWGYRARQCAKQVESSLTAAKVTTLGKATKNGNIYWELSKESDGYYVNTVVLNSDSSVKSETKKKVGPSNLKVTYGSTDTDVAVTPLRLCYNRASGEIYDYIDDGKGGTSATTLTSTTKITVKNPGGTKSYEITLVPKTGKVYR